MAEEVEPDIAWGRVREKGRSSRSELSTMCVSLRPARRMRLCHVPPCAAASGWTLAEAEAEALLRGRELQGPRGAPGIPYTYGRPGRRGAGIGWETGVLAFGQVAGCAARRPASTRARRLLHAPPPRILPPGGTRSEPPGAAPLRSAPGPPGGQTVHGASPAPGPAPLRSARASALAPLHSAVLRGPRSEV
jgi:hypothetical protein